MTSTSLPDIPRLNVSVGSMPVPALLRPSIEAALEGRALDGGPESTVGRAVAEAARTARTGGASQC